MWVGKKKMITEKHDLNKLDCDCQHKDSICPCVEKCPLSTAMDIIGGKWKLQILCALQIDGPIRYNELKQKINGITNTMLSGSLKKLEADGLVKRTQYNVMPVRVEYSTTAAVDDLGPILMQLGKWANNIALNKPALE
jgi:DNA-binding HxlR family transcriptional regulator